MAVRKQAEKNVRKITKVGKKSLAVTLPVDEIKKLGWKERQKVTVKRTKGGFVVRDWKNR